MINVLTAETLDAEQTLRMANQQILEQGKELYTKGGVTVEQADARTAQVRVKESLIKIYRVTVQLSGRQVYTSCTCSQVTPWVICKHRVAAVLGLHDYLLAHPPNVWKEVIQQAIRPVPRKTGVISQGVVLFSLQKRATLWSIVPHSLAGKYVPPEVRDDQEEVARLIAREGLSSEARPLRSRISQQTHPNVAPETIAATNLAMMSTANANYGIGTYAYGSLPSSGIYDSILSLLPGCLVYLGSEGNPLQQRIHVLPEGGELALTMQRANDGLHVATQIAVNGQALELHSGKTHVILRDPLWVLADATLVQVKDTGGNGSSLVEFPKLVIPQKDEADFVKHHLLPLAENMQVRGDLITWEEVDTPPQPRVYLSESKKELLVHLRFGYGDYEVPYDPNAPEYAIQRKDATHLVRLRRQLEAENELWQSLSSYGLKRAQDPGWFVLRKNVTLVDFLLTYVTRLIEQGYTVYGEQELTSARVNRNRPTISFSVHSGIDWFDLEAVVSFGELEVSLKEIRKVLRKKGRYIKLGDGSIGILPDEWTERYRHLFALSDETETGLRLANSQLTLLDQLLGEADRAKTDAEFERRRQRLRDFASITSHTLPQGFHGTLRPYQQAGYDWLHFLHAYHFGGCLADDMGTGKTVVTLAFLQSLREQQHSKAADLVVMPRSLLFNWEREAANFAPNLRVFIHADQQRIQKPQEFDQYDLVLTTYGTMLRDIKLLRQHTFHYIILDEAQAIKNPVAETTKAARLLQGEHRLTLTGTPVENSTLELWSQFAFLNPGLLGNLDYFREEFVTPIERKQDTDAAQFLRKLVYPFILRRTKDQVALDLPPRTERLLISDMEPEQRVLYNQQRDYYRGVLLGLIEEEGLNNARMKILEGLLRLRQICNHPRLVTPDFNGASAKLDVLLETLETLYSEGHKALVFSQFVQMLTLVREELDARQIPYSYLDGQTRDRQSVVDQFQNNAAIPFFLISLKAGGVGLNLTAADYVIHIDPWWNPAVEMQATDRTHRIGQAKPVFVYKLVVRDSVEEKILQLQEQKRALVEQIISTESSVFKSLTRADVEVLFT